MIKTLILGGIFGGLAAFAWSTFSWEVLGWHEAGMVRFDNEDEVSAMIASQVTNDGMYILPSIPPTEGMSAEKKKAIGDAVKAKMQTGPIVVAAVRRNGFGSFGKAIAIQLLGLMGSALLLTWMLQQTSGLSYARRVTFLGITGLAASVIIDLPNWNWFGFSGVYTAVNTVDTMITWLLAGLVIAKVVKPRTS